MSTLRYAVGALAVACGVVACAAPQTAPSGATVPPGGSGANTSTSPATTTPSSSAPGSTASPQARQTPRPSPSSTSAESGFEDFTDKQVDTPASGAAPPQSNVTGSNYTYTVEQYLDYIIKDLDSEWTKWFVAAGYKEPEVGIQIVQPGRPYTTNCTDRNGRKLTVNDSYPNAFYCPVDSMVVDGRSYQGVVILPVTTFQQMWTGNVLKNRSKTVGDFAAAAITAHEFGHHVQDELKRQSNARSSTARKVGDPTGKNRELVADCFAGVWMASAYYTGLLTDTDYEEAVAALESIGDKAVTSDPHGTPAERATALKVGYHGSGSYRPGSPGACIATYWR